MGSTGAPNMTGRGQHSQPQSRRVQGNHQRSPRGTSRAATTSRSPLQSKSHQYQGKCRARRARWQWLHCLESHQGTCSMIKVTAWPHLTPLPLSQQLPIECSHLKSRRLFKLTHSVQSHHQIPSNPQPSHLNWKRKRRTVWSSTILWSLPKSKPWQRMHLTMYSCSKN